MILSMKPFKKNPNAHPLCHSDRGYQYTNRLFHNKLEKAGMTQSMSRVGKCIDNGTYGRILGYYSNEKDIMVNVLPIKKHL